MVSWSAKKAQKNEISDGFLTTAINTCMLGFDALPLQQYPFAAEDMYEGGKVCEKKLRLLPSPTCVSKTLEFCSVERAAVAWKVPANDRKGT